MTCHAFQAVNATIASFLGASRAERAAAIAHYKRCEECRDWFMDRGEIDAGPGLEGWVLTDLVDMVEAVTDQDRQDEEFCSVADIEVPDDGSF